MAGPVIGGRRPISWRLAIVVAFVVLHPLAVEKIRYYDQREFAGLFDPA